MLEIGLLGEFRIADGAGVITSLRSARTQLLLSYLLLHRRAPVPRQHLAFVFWPDSAEAQARTNLRREIHRLRQCLPDADRLMELDGAALWWRGGAQTEVDLDQFEVAASEAARARDSGDRLAMLRAGETAMRAYRGPLLPAHYDDWVVEERDRLHRRALSLLDDLVEGAEAADDLAVAVVHARRRVALEPLEERGHADLIRLEARRGDRAAAIRSYHRCCAVLERELGVVPGERVVEAYATAQAMGRPATSGFRHRELAARPPLIGRQAERELLLDRWHRRSGPEVVVIRGEAGIGKTRLLDDVSATIARGGSPVSTARCFPGSAGLPLGPLRTWFTAPELATAVDGIDDASKAVVARLVGVSQGDDPTPVLADPSSGPGLQARLFAACVGAVQAVERPMLLAIDDLQWCDKATLDWLVFLCRFAPDAPIMLAASVRDEELTDRAPVAVALQELAGTVAVTDVDLRPLAPDETAELAALRLGEQVPADVAARLHEVTGGFPLFVLETAELWSEADLDAGEVSRALAPRARAILAGRLRSVSSPARHVLDVAAVIGQDFTIGLLSDTVDLDEPSVVDALDELWARRLVRVTTPGSYDVSHDLVREAVVEELSPARSWLLHRRVAQSLELGGTPTGPLAGRIAHHYEAAGQFARAARFNLAAAVGAARVFAHDEAVRRGEHALDLLSRSPEGVERDRAELDIRIELARPLNAMEGYGSPRLERDLRRAVELADRLDDRSARARCITGLWAVRFVQGHTAESHRLATEALRLTDARGELAAQAHLVLGGSLCSLGRPVEGIEHLREAARLATAGSDSTMVLGFRPEVMALAWGAHALWLAGFDDDAVDSAARAIVRAEEHGEPYDCAMAHAYAAVTHQLRGDRSETGLHASAAAELCQRFGFGYYREWALMLRGWLDGGADGIGLVETGLANLAAQNAHARRPYYLGLLADAQRRAGRPDRAAAVLLEAIALARANDDRWWEPDLLRAHAQLHPGPQAVAGLRSAEALAVAQGSRALAERARAALAHH